MELSFASEITSRALFGPHDRFILTPYSGSLVTSADLGAKEPTRAGSVCGRKSNTTVLVWQRSKQGSRSDPGLLFRF